jgi:lysophospholipase L1-like esterase
MRKRTIAGLAAVVLAVGACGDGGAAEITDAPADPVTTVGDTHTATTAAAAMREMEALVYVAMGDSLGNTPDEPEGVIWQYAEKLEQHFGTDVDLRNRVVGGIGSTRMLDQLRTNDDLRSELAEADIVTTDIPIDVWVKPMQIVGGWGGADPSDCGGDDHEQCLRDALDQYKADTDAIIDELVAICPGDVLIRLYDNYMLNTGYKLETGTLATTNPYWKAGMDYVAESAARYGIPVAQVYNEFMGDSGTDDPYTKGLLLDDQLHPNAKGAALIADLLDTLGY